MHINDFYANREVFVTGCTGFLGKSLIEKLLRDSPKIKVFYVLIRTKKSATIDERLEQLKNDQVFDRIRKECPEVLNKLHAIPGNTDQLGLGIQSSDLKLLQNVSIIFHIAANVKFDDPLRSSILSNTRGTHEVIKIAETLKHLVAFLHCSTAYCNPYEDVVEEKVYKLPVDWRKAIKIAETCDENTLNYLSYKYMEYYPNTYCFTKNLSEQLIKEYSVKLPISLFRPSIVMSALTEPSAGWLDNLNGPIASLVAVNVGIAPVVCFGNSVKLDLMPVDFVTKLTIVATYKRGLQFLSKEPVPDGLEVINCAAGDIYEMCMRGAFGLLYLTSGKNPMENKMWHYSCNRLTVCYYNFLLQMVLMGLPLAIIMDTILRFGNGKPVLVQLCRRIVYGSKAVYFFSQKEFKMINNNMMNLEKSIPKSEIALYGIHKDLNVNLADYFLEFIRGVKYYLFNQPKEATAQAHTRSKILYIISNSIKMFTISLLIFYLWSKFTRLF